MRERVHEFRIPNSEFVIAHLPSYFNVCSWLSSRVMRQRVAGAGDGRHGHRRAGRERRTSESGRRRHVITAVSPLPLVNRIGFRRLSDWRHRLAVALDDTRVMSGAPSCSGTDVDHGRRYPGDPGQRVAHAQVLGQRPAVGHERRRQHDAEIFALDDRDRERFEVAEALAEPVVQREDDLGLVAARLWLPPPGRARARDRQ